MLINPHDDSDPIERFVNLLDAKMEALLSRCTTCGTPAMVMPGSGTRHLLGIDHQPGCPEYIDEDAIPVAVVQPRPEWLAAFYRQGLESQ